MKCIWFQVRTFLDFLFSKELCAATPAYLICDIKIPTSSTVHTQDGVKLCLDLTREIDKQTITQVGGQCQ